MDKFLGQYTFLQNLGEGSNGVVFKVKECEQGNIRAVKQFSGYVEDKQSPKYKQFLKEFNTLSCLGNCTHPNIVHVYKADLVDHKAFYEMDYIDGTPLSVFLKRKKFLDIDEVLRCCRDLLSAMAYVHVDIYRYQMDREKDGIPTDPNDGSKVLIDAETEKRLIREYGIVHNDIHSCNLMRNNYDGRYILLDFGISLRGGVAIRESGRGDGALAYMAPEKIQYKQVSFQSDVYSIGTVMYEVLTGRVPFPLEDENGKERSSATMFRIHSTEAVPSIFEARKAAWEASGQTGEYVRDYPLWLEQLILKNLEKKPENRYENAKAIFTDFNGKMQTTLSDYYANQSKAFLYEEERENRLRLEKRLREKTLLTERLMARDRQLKELLSARVKRGAVWSLVVVLAVAVALIYAPLVA